MSINLTAIDTLIQYALLVAGEEDEFFDRQLGPIHLIKYVYLADLAYSKRHSGEIYTSAPWRFYNYGPWANEVFERIEPALNKINADMRHIPSNYDNDFKRWSIHDSDLLEKTEKSLPIEITTYLRMWVHKYKQDTPTILDHVYKTEPMLQAAPNEYLDFKLAIPVKLDKQVQTPQLRMDALSNKKKKKFKQKIRELQEKREGKKATKQRLVNPFSDSLYDDIYMDGITWLEQLAGENFEAGETVAEFSDDVWKSTTRSGKDVPGG